MINHVRFFKKTWLLTFIGEKLTNLQIQISASSVVPDDEAVILKEFKRALEIKGINKSLKSAGVKPGDTIITGSMEWTWTNDEGCSTWGNV